MFAEVHLGPAAEIFVGTVFRRGLCVRRDNHDRRNGSRLDLRPQVDERDLKPPRPSIM
jgi:hypothetical protein